MKQLQATTAGGADVLQRWERAYCRFETPKQEQAKFRRRLVSLGVRDWARSWRVVELFCGRGSGLHAWNQLGFTNLEGLDLSKDLAAQYGGPGRVYVGDARRLPFADASRDVLCVQGGLHHLLLPDDLQQTLSEMQRVLRPGGRLILVEPWRTPFLDLAHAACSVGWLRRSWGKLDALATMIELERTTYEDWLGQPEAIMNLVDRYFRPLIQRVGRGKLMLVAAPRPAADEAARWAA